jgi:acyl carrier protein
MNDFRRALREALVAQFGADAASLDDDTKLFSGGLIDSLGVMDLVSFVERKLGERVPPSAITLENFDSIAQIVAFARTLGGARQDP